MGKLSIVFPGQGSQHSGMFKELHDEYTVVRDTFSQASSVLGYDLAATIFDGPEEELNKTWITQPAILTCSVALWRVWQELGGQQPDLIAGHSLGEYSALACSGVIAFDDAVALVEKRGKLMAEAVPAGVGAMAAIIGLDDDAVLSSCEAAANNEIVTPVNYNSPGQVVIAGHAAAVERAIEQCKEAGARKAMPLAVSVPSHCMLMKPAAEELLSALNDIELNQPEADVVNNADVAVVKDVNAIRDALVKQLYSPVRWTESMQFAARQGVTTMYEFGPGKVLTGLVKRIDKSIKCTAINKVDALKAALETNS